MVRMCVPIAGELVLIADCPVGCVRIAMATALLGHTCAGAAKEAEA